MLVIKMRECMIVIIEKKKVFNWDIRKLMLLIVNIIFILNELIFIMYEKLF